MREYYYARNSEKLGPFSIKELRNENISKRTLIWFEGLPSWQFAEDLEELEVIFEPFQEEVVLNEQSSIINDNSAINTQPAAVNEDNYFSTPVASVLTNEPINDHYDSEENFVDTEPARNNHGFFKAPFSFKGRIRRTEWWISIIITQLSFTFLAAFTEGDSNNSIVLLVIIPLIWFNFAQV